MIVLAKALVHFVVRQLNQLSPLRESEFSQLPILKIEAQMLC